MATDYDAPRATEPGATDDESLEGLTGRRNDATTAVLDVDDGEDLDAFELPGADLSGEEFVVRVVPKQSDEFTCSSASSCTTAPGWPRNRTAYRSASTAPDPPRRFARIG